ncbi:MAG: hypothetical protein LBP34_05120 [Flavobacteriaceae bacterium]|jgi:hypothetical protein|nr:hypothetical protein [Flavobacteriaceae bacterium]
MKKRTTQSFFDELKKREWKRYDLTCKHPVKGENTSQDLSANANFQVGGRSIKKTG